jgi:hypothetical protein
MNRAFCMPCWEKLRVATRYRLFNAFGTGNWICEVRDARKELE